MSGVGLFCLPQHESGVGREHWCERLLQKGVAAEDVVFLFQVLNPAPAERWTAGDVVSCAYLKIAAVFLCRSLTLTWHGILFVARVLMKDLISDSLGERLFYQMGRTTHKPIYGSDKKLSMGLY